MGLGKVTQSLTKNKSQVASEEGTCPTESKISSFQSIVGSSPLIDYDLFFDTPPQLTQFQG